MRILLIILLAVLAAACGGGEQQQDSNREVVAAPDASELAPATIREPDAIDVFLSVDGFRNVQRMCADGTGIYVTSRGGVTFGNGGEINSTGGGSGDSSIAVVADDPACPRS